MKPLIVGFLALAGGIGGLLGASYLIGTTAERLRPGILGYVHPANFGLLCLVCLVLVGLISWLVGSAILERGRR